MFRTIFRKQLALFLGVFLISFACLGIAMSWMINGYFTNQKAQSLINIGENMSTTIGFYQGAVDTPAFRQDANVLMRYMNASFMLVDNNYALIGKSPDITNISANLNIPAFAPLGDGKTVVTQGRLNGVFAEDNLIVAYPIMLNGTYAGAIIMGSSISELKAAIGGMVRITVLCMIVFAIIGFILIYISSRALSKPLHEMNGIARVISRGHFEKRISVKSKDEIGQLAESFNNMAESLERQDKDRRDFITNISHDLRSPLTSMHGFIEAILDGTVPEEKRSHYLGIVLDETDRLAKLTNDIISLNRAESKELPIDRTTFDINALIRDTAMRFENRAKSKSVELNLRFAGETANIWADREKIQRVIYNLLDNALKFAPDTDGRIDVTTEIKDGKLWTSVRDNGKGIAKEDQKKVFDRFFKADMSRGEDKKGSGIGLAIVKEFIKAHGETITLDSEPGKGCVFKFSAQTAEREEEE
ncbi:MAG: cell wall metabolism sensor histidine kinase WalK [Defluviitaleaceae bacterium]|nr:cell wall metabolism sensor histidine kinase WalK [Defluviitaleaceae bacterium]